jgi:hypothetical protein
MDENLLTIVFFPFHSKPMGNREECTDGCEPWP